jgi:hypothetical protein
METDLEELLTVEGTIEAEIVKAKLENYQIPVHLKFESLGHIFGITMNGLGKVTIMVPKALLEEAREILAD